MDRARIRSPVLPVSGSALQPSPTPSATSPAEARTLATMEEEMQRQYEQLIEMADAFLLQVWGRARERTSAALP